jgi:predicted O-linked N-acetylglucosamine transferase (SPINDLY family)
MELTIDQALQKGVEAHKAGRVQEADRLYTAIIKVQPEHPDANHNMGILAAGVGKVTESLPFFKIALRSNPKIEQFWISYIDILLRLDRIKEANELIFEAKNKGFTGKVFDTLEERILRKDHRPDQSPLKLLLEQAINLREIGDFKTAINILSEKASQFKDEPNLLALLSHCLILADNLEEAALYLNKAKKIDPKNALVNWNEVRLLLRNKQLSEALAIATEANQRFPNDIQGLGVLGICLRANGEINDSLKVLNRAIDLNPSYAEALMNRGLIWLQTGEKNKALVDLETAHQLKPFIKQIWDPLVGLKLDFKDYKSAISILINILEIDPTHEKSCNLLSAVAPKVDDTELVIKGFKKILEIRKNDSFSYVNLGVAQTKIGNNTEAIENFKFAISLEPNFAEAHYFLANTLREERELEKAIISYKKAISINPTYVEAMNNMGSTQKRIGEINNALESYRKALSIKPDYSEAHNNLGNILSDQGNFKDAIEAYRNAIFINPNYYEAHNNLGVAFKDTSKLEEAVEAYDKAISIKSDFAEAYNNKGVALKHQNKIVEALEAFNAALNINANHPETSNNLGDCLRHLGRHSEALELFQKTVSLDPKYKKAYVNIGFVLQDMGRSEDAEHAYRKAMALDPDFSDAFSNMLFSMSYNDKYEMDHIVEQHLLFSEQFEKDKSDKLANFKNDNDENRSLNIGFVSADFRNHPVADFFIPILAALKEQTDLKLFAYYNYLKEDSRTAETKNYMNTWRSIWGKSDEDAKAIIKSDKIDILFDLSGHTGHNRLPLFAKKPAPIQVSWLGYQFTTGLKSMDYYIGNKFAVPSGKYDHQFSEKIVGLPFNPAYIPQVKTPKISKPPILKNNFITFASFFNTLKINSDVLSVWSRILNEIPSSRLAMGGIKGGEVEQRFKDYFRSQNISLDRIEFIQKVNYEKFLSLHNEVDLCLAPFPNTGGSTIFSSLWMGVPTIVLLGETYFTRGSASIMHLAGLSQFVAADVEDYVAKAHMFAKDKELLCKIRTQLPKTLPDSSLCDPKLYAETLNTALRQMWKTWCSEKKPQAFEI